MTSSPSHSDRDSTNHAIVDAAHLREGLEQFPLQAVGAVAMQDLRRELFDSVAGVLGGGEPPGVSADHQAKNVFDGAAEFGGVVEQGGVFFVEHSGGGAAPKAVAQRPQLGANTVPDQQE